MWRNFPCDRVSPHLSCGEIFHLSLGGFLHMTNFFSTDAVCGVCDKYEVCLNLNTPLFVHLFIMIELYFFLLLNNAPKYKFLNECVKVLLDYLQTFMF